MDEFKTSVLQLPTPKDNLEKTTIKFKNVDVNIKTYYLKSLKNPEKNINYLWHKKTETQIRHLAKDKENRSAEIKGLVYLQRSKGYEITLPTLSILDKINENQDEFSQLIDALNEKRPPEKKPLKLVSVNERGEIEIDYIGIS